MGSTDYDSRVRHAIRVRGTVQGVGFRPTVFRAARAAGLSGLVRNDAEGVWVEVEGRPEAVAAFPEALRREAPPLARIVALEVMEVEARGGSDFRVAPSERRAAASAMIPADAATCGACLGELFDPKNRRYRYPFINCTDCGPRFTIVVDVPYDRAKTTMSTFAMCTRCRAEYEDPGDRRFHAVPNACGECGPRAVLATRRAALAEDWEAIARAAALLADGAIVAVKGLGGYQLAVDARREAAVARLRRRKRRPDKPLAVMARGLAHVERVAYVDEAARRVLESAARPIVLLPRAGEGAAPNVAPGLSEIGVMLPTTPLHHLLLAEGPPLLVMTSGNQADEPIARDDEEALAALGGVADAFLAHDRAIHTRADDSVVRFILGAPQPVRRGRGFAPDPVELGFEAPSVLAVGAHMKNAVCITRGSGAYLSQHIGDLDTLEGNSFFVETIDKLARLLGASPVAVAHDLHPDYASTRWALASGLPRVAVQHHHAHIASCLAENRFTGAALGVAFDGTGCGPAGDLWGGELLIADLGGFARLGHLRPIALPGGEAAIREPWRLALAALADAEAPFDGVEHVPAARRDAVRRLLRSPGAAPRATGAGRWFDAVAALLGVRDAVTYEGQAAVELEALATGVADAPPYPFEIASGVVDLRPAVRAVAAALAAGEPSPEIAARFHATLAFVIDEWCRRARERHGVNVVALSGGCFQNRILTERAAGLLAGSGFRVLLHRQVPPNDGGVALGQAAVAAHRMLHDKEAADVPRDTG